MHKQVTEFLQASTALKKAYEDIKYGKMNRQLDLEEDYKPLLKPIREISSKIKPIESSEMPLGRIATEYLSLRQSKVAKTDQTFGIRSEDGVYYIGNTPITIVHNDITLPDGSRYTGTEGLWELLTLALPNLALYSEDDLSNYKELILRTSAHKRNNDPNSPHFKSNGGYKYRYIIKPLLDEQKRLTVDESLSVGEGLGKILTKNQKEYVYWNSLDELLDRLYILWGEIKSGNNNPTLRNEIVNIIQEFKEM